MKIMNLILKDLLSKDGSVMIHQRNLKFLAVEMYKITYKLSPEFMWDMVEEINTKYHTRSSCSIDYNENNETVYTKKSNYRLQKTNTTSFGLQSFRSLGPKICAMIPNELKSIKSLSVFKEKLNCAYVQRSQITVFKIQTQPRLDFNHSDRSDLRYGR